MKLNQVWTKALLLLTLACAVPMASAGQPKTPPPRGHAYGYRAMAGTLPLLLYMQQDGSRELVLHNCHPKWDYVIVATCDLEQWDVLGLMEVDEDGTGIFIDMDDLPYCFYDVKCVR